MAVSNEQFPKIRECRWCIHENTQHGAFNVAEPLQVVQNAAEQMMHFEQRREATENEKEQRAGFVERKRANGKAINMKLKKVLFFNTTSIAESMKLRTKLFDKKHSLIGFQRMSSKHSAIERTEKILFI